jgi:hypothetical protein
MTYSKAFLKKEGLGKQKKILSGIYIEIRHSKRNSK